MAEYDFHFTAEVMDGIFGEVITARGAWDTLGERLDNMEQGTGDTYTKAEVDTMLAEKVNTEEGKGLSSNDFTDSDKEQITTNKNNILWNTDNGVKNIYSLNPRTAISQGITFVAGADGTVTANGTASGDAVFYLSDTLDIGSGYVLYGEANQDGSISSGWFMDTYITGYANRRTFTNYVGTEENTKIWRLIIKSGVTVSDLIFKPMICKQSTFDMSQTYQPYAPTNRELYEMILALQSGT